MSYLRRLSSFFKDSRYEMSIIATASTPTVLFFGVLVFLRKGYAMRTYLIVTLIAVFNLLGFALAMEGRDTEMKQEKAILAGGCFWCTESVFKDVDGVIDALCLLAHP